MILVPLTCSWQSLKMFDMEVSTADRNGEATKEA